MAKKGPRQYLILACQESGHRNYITSKNTQKTQKPLELKKFCRFCRRHTLHKEVK